MITLDAPARTLEPAPQTVPLNRCHDEKGEQRRVTNMIKQNFSEQTVWMLAVRDQRDRNAFGHLFDYFAPRLKGVAMRSGMPGEAAEDVAQEVMLSVWRKAEMFDPHRAQGLGMDFSNSSQSPH